MMEEMPSEMKEDFIKYTNQERIMQFQRYLE